MKSNQLIGLLCLMAAFFVWFSQGNPVENVVDPLSPQEQAICNEFKDIVPSEVAKLVSSDLAAAANFIEMDAKGPKQLQEDYSIKDLQAGQNSMLWAYRIDLPSQHPQFSQKLSECYVKYLGEDFKAEDLVRFHRIVAKALSRV